MLWFRVRIVGVPGHAAEGRNATNAIEKSLAVIGALRELESEMNLAPPPPFDLYTHPINLNVGAIRGGDWPSTVPGVCVTDYRIALYPGIADRRAQGADRAGRRRRDRGPARVRRGGLPGVLVRGLRHRRRPPADHHARARVRAISRAPPPALVSTTGTTDAAVFGNVGGIPAVCFGPYAEQAHGVGERVYLPSVVQTAQVLGLFIRDWCGLS